MVRRSDVRFVDEGFARAPRIGRDFGEEEWPVVWPVVGWRTDDHLNTPIAHVRGGRTQPSVGCWPLLLVLRCLLTSLTSRTLGKWRLSRCTVGIPLYLPLW